MCSLVLVACLVVSPCRALADDSLISFTYVGTYSLVTSEERDQAACLALLGESYNTMDSGLKSRLFNSTTDGGVGTDTNPNFPDYAFYRDNLVGYYFPGGNYRWYSKLDGFSYSWAFSKAQKDLEAAIRWWDAYGDTVDAPPDGYEGNNFYVLIRQSLSRNEVITFPDNYSVTVNDGQLYSYNNKFGDATNTTWDVVQGNFYWTKANTIYVNTSTGNAIYWSATQLNVVSGNTTVSDVVTPVSTDVKNTYGCPDGYYRRFKTTGRTYNKLVTTCTNVFIDKQPATAIPGGGGGCGGGGGGAIPAPDPVNPPDPEPITPEPEPEPVDPGDGWTTIVNNVYNVTQTLVDLQPVIDAIAIANQSIQQTNRSINTLNDNLETAFQALLGQVDAWGNWWSDTWSSYTSWLGEWYSTFGQIFEGLRNDLDGNANDITVWLNMIYNRIGARRTTEPDPSVDDDGWLDWWQEILARLFEAMTDDMQEFVHDVLDGFSALRELFPFSIPWDLGIFLGLLQSDPVTPVFDLPLPYGYENGSVIYSSIHVDCTPWNNIAQVIRQINFTLFAFWLAWNTKSLLGFGEDV